MPVFVDQFDVVPTPEPETNQTQGPTRPEPSPADHIERVLRERAERAARLKAS